MLCFPVGIFRAHDPQFTRWTAQSTDWIRIRISVQHSRKHFVFDVEMFRYLSVVKHATIMTVIFKTSNKFKSTRTHLKWSSFEAKMKERMSKTNSRDSDAMNENRLNRNKTEKPKRKKKQKNKSLIVKYFIFKQKGHNFSLSKTNILINVMYSVHLGFYQKNQ